MPPPVRDGAIASIDALAIGGRRSEGSPSRSGRPSSHSSVHSRSRRTTRDFVAPGKEAAGAWAEIEFAPPVVQRLRKDWSWLGVA